MTVAEDTDRAVVERYLRETLYEAEAVFARGQGAEGGPDEPAKAKFYRGVPRFPLDRARGVPGGSGHLTAGVLSSLLGLAYGVTRWEPPVGAGWPVHRTVPSARCLFPTELYVVLPGTSAGVPAGVHHFDPVHHGLALLRPGDWSAALGDAVGADLDGAVCAVLVTSVLWKTAFKYRDYAYRLCMQEAGMVVGNVQVVAGALGFDHHVHHRSVDAEVATLAGLEPDQETVTAVVAVYPRGARPRGVRPRSAGGVRAVPPISPAHTGIGRLDERTCAMVLAVDRASRLRRADRSAHRGATSRRCAEQEPPLRLPAARTELPDLAAATLDRTSGSPFFRPAPEPVDAVVLADIAHHAAAAYPSDLRPVTEPPGVGVHLAVRGVRDVPPGIYRWCTVHFGLHLVTPGDPAAVLRAAMTVPNVDPGTANVVAYLTADHGRALRDFGSTAYRLAHVESGAVAQRICLASAAHGLAARVHNGYDARRVAHLLGTTVQAASPLFQIVIGRDRSGARYGLPLGF
ncbi:hypothetical protein SUDANB95_01960 [Actinosynnema sp. ALI-1.44]